MTDARCRGARCRAGRDLLNRAGSRFAAPKKTTTCSPCGIVRPASSISSLAVRNVTCTGLSKRRNSSSADSISEGSDFRRAIASGLRNSASIPLPIMFIVVSWPASSVNIALKTSSSSVWRSPRPSAATMMLIKSSRGCYPAIGGEVREVAAHVRDRLAHFNPRVVRADNGIERHAERAHPVAEHRLVGVVGAHHLGQHVDRKWKRDVLDQIHRAASLDRVEQVVDDLLDPRLQSVHDARRKKSGHQAAQASVVGRIAKNDRMLERLAHRLEAIVGRERIERVEIEGKKALVAQNAMTVGVAGRNPKPDWRPQERIASAQELVERIWIGREQPPVEAADRRG